MGKLSITKEFTWDMAHMLASHQGLCKNLHGHTYKLQVEVTRNSEQLITESEAASGMVLDFKDLKKVVKEEIIDPFDHAFVYWTGSSDVVEHQIAELLQKEGRKVVKVDFRPTAEEMAVYFLEVLNAKLEGEGVRVSRVKVWETPTSFAEIREDE
ncbi:6-pyruvoyl trahydropterin synthase family protein [Natroniella sp. ANB-PHB2]|uniref:6-pyruvoyl trahydropterin synthase family protein n=1 Tax=Natroniella sp. ANB-PHB2 TaxID=3384444 RepID=UPI0038D39142